MKIEPIGNDYRKHRAEVFKEALSRLDATAREIAAHMIAVAFAGGLWLRMGPKGLAVAFIAGLALAIIVLVVAGLLATYGERFRE